MKDNKRLFDLYSIIFPYLDYAKKMLYSPFDEFSLSEENCNYLEGVFAGLLLTLWKDEYITKDENKNLSTLVIPEFLDTVITKIAKKVDDKYLFGNFVFQTHYELIDFVRNKIAHGDFTISGNYLLITEGDSYALMKIDDLVSFATSIYINFEKAKLRSPNTKGFVYYEHSNDDEFSLEKFLKDSYYIELIDKPSDERNAEYYNVMSAIKGSIINYINTHKLQVNYDTVKKVLNNYKVFTEPLNAEMDVRITRCSDIDDVELVKNHCEHCDTVFGELTDSSKVSVYSHSISKFLESNSHKACLSKGIINNLLYLKNIKKNGAFSLTNEDLDPDIKRQLILYIFETIVSSNIVGFNILYQYGLDEIYNEKHRTYYLNLFNGEIFDFSKLDIDLLDDPNMLVEHEYNDFYEQFECVGKCVLETLEKADRGKRNYNGYLEHTDIINSEKASELKSIYEQARDDAKFYKDAYLFLADFKEERFDRYVRNRNIIEHIRNAIEHGNIYVNHFNEDCSLENTLITIEDIHNGELTYTISVTLTDFLTLFSDINIRALDDFLFAKARLTIDKKRIYS